MLRTKDEILNDIENKLNDIEEGKHLNKLRLAGHEEIFDKLFDSSDGIETATNDLTAYQNDPDLDGFYTELNGIFGVINVISQDSAFGVFNDADAKPDPSTVSDPRESEMYLEMLRNKNVVRHVLLRAGLTLAKTMTPENKEEIEQAIKEERTAKPKQVLKGGIIKNDLLEIDKHEFDLDELKEQANADIYVPNTSNNTETKIVTLKVADQAGWDFELVKFICTYKRDKFSGKMEAWIIKPCEI